MVNPRGRWTLLASSMSLLSLVACDGNAPTSADTRALRPGVAATHALAQNSSLVSVDDPVFGTNAVTRDNATGLEWLDLTFSTNRSFDDITGVNGPSQLAAGGDFAGWRYATVAEVTSLFLDAGIPDVPGFSPANRDPVLDLMALVGITCIDECSGNPTSLGISATADPANPPLLFVPNLQNYPLAFGRADLSLLIGPDTRGPAWGSWLVRPGVVVDATAPETEVLSAIDAEGVGVGNGGLTLSSSITVSFVGSDDVGVVAFQCSVDAAAYSSCTSPATYSGLGVGSHVFAVRSVDAAGNVDLSPASISWTVITPSRATGNLIAAIGNMGLARGVASSLTAPLGEVSRLLDDGNPNNDGAVCSKLGAFSSQVRVKASSGQLTTEDAGALLQAATAIRQSLGC